MPTFTWRSNHLNVIKIIIMWLERHWSRGNALDQIYESIVKFANRLLRGFVGVYLVA